MESECLFPCSWHIDF